jgi:hypothetical protein
MFRSEYDGLVVGFPVRMLGVVDVCEMCKAILELMNVLCCAVVCLQSSVRVG